MDANPVLFRDLTYIFLAAALGGLLAWRLRLPLILGFVLGGIVVSPFTPGPHLSDLHTFEVFAEVGVVLLMFSTGVEFLKSLGSHRPDCLVLDLHMPGMSGFEIISQLTQAGHKLPVVTITGHDTPETRQRLLDAGVSSYLCKPVDGTTLLDAVMAAIASGRLASP